jgi:hypothetical protein
MKEKVWPMAAFFSYPFTVETEKKQGRRFSKSTTETVIVAHGSDS